MNRNVGVVVMVGMSLGMLSAGCGNRKSSLLLERQARGPLAEERQIATWTRWILEPLSQTKTQNSIDVAVTYATTDYLNQFFNNREIFGQYAGMNPFFPEQMVFYVKIVNKSGKKIRIDPAQFVLLDDLGNQYQSLSADYSTALAESLRPTIGYWSPRLRLSKVSPDFTLV